MEVKIEAKAKMMEEVDRSILSISGEAICLT